MGKVLADRGIKKVVTLTWKYGAGEEAINVSRKASPRPAHHREGTVPAFPASNSSRC